MAPRETENNAYAKFWGDKQRTLWYVMVFLEWSIVHKQCFQFLLGLTIASREIEDNSYAKFDGQKQALWY